jgi:uroporphyrinogen III methyltransferase/synthase
VKAHGFNVMTWPQLAIQPPQSFAALDEAIEDLFGYDWLIFVNEDAARFFLERFNSQGHDVSELDSLRVCAIGEVTAHALEQSHVHVDVVATNVTASSVVEQIANCVGGSEFLQRLNFLMPQASIGREYLTRELQEAHARVDVIVAYQTVAATDATRLSVLKSLLSTGSVDGIAFTNETEVSDCARLFDMNDMGRLLRNVTVFLVDQRTVTRALQQGIPSAVINESSSQEQMVQALMKRFPV